jgi:hypothetical protein
VCYDASSEANPMSESLQPHRTGQVSGVQEAVPGEASRPDVGRLYPLGALLLLALGFAMGALSLVSFARQEGVPVGFFTQTDFPAMVIASRLAGAGDGARLYDLQAQLGEQQRLAREGYLRLSPTDSQLYYPYPYTPFIALLLAPLAPLGPLAGMALWDLLNLAALAAGLWALLSDLPLPGAARPLLALGVLTSFPWIVNLEQGQSSGLVALAMALGVALLRRGQDWPAGAVFGLLFLKIQWLPFIALALLLDRRRRALGSLGAVGAALALVATLALGPGWVPAYLGVLSTASSSGSTFLLTPAASHSLNGGIYALLGPGAASLVGPLTLVGTLLVAGLVVLSWNVRTLERWNVFKSQRSNVLTFQRSNASDARFGLALLAAIFTNPQLNTHDLSLLVVPAALGFAAMHGGRSASGEGAPHIADRFEVAWHGCLWLLYFAPLLLLGPLLDRENPVPIRLTTWLMALMLVLLAIVGFRAGRPASNVFSPVES